jgi:hypothetical protein
MKLYVLLSQGPYCLEDTVDRVSPTLSLKSLLYETDFTDEEVDTIASLMVGDTFKLDDDATGYLAIRRVS